MARLLDLVGSSAFATPTRFALWAVGAYVVLRGVRYVLVARVYLTCAVQEVRLQAIAREDIAPNDLAVQSVTSSRAAPGPR